MQQSKPQRRPASRRVSETGQSPGQRPPKKVVDINLNRKLLSHGIIEQLRDTVKSKEMVAGSAIIELLDEYDRMRYLMEGLVTAYNKNDEQTVRKILEVLRILL